VARSLRRRPDPSEATRERLLDGAVRAVARHGLAKLGMSDVSDSAGVSRATLYRYFPTREALLDALAQREAERFFEHVLAALEAAPPGETRLRIALETATRRVREHPALHRLLESDPAYVLESIRRRFPEICAALERPLAPLLAETEAVRSGAVTTARLVDWTTRLLLTLYLVEDPDPDATVRSLAAMYRLVTGRDPEPDEETS
jgi:AcrR family transcriptional regulator